MGRIEKSVEIKALPEEVWPLLFFDRLPEWLDIFKKVECTSQKRDCAGATFHVVGETAFMKTEFDVEITELVENEKAGWRSTLGGFGKSSLNPTAAGTELNFIINYALPYSIFGKMLDKLIVGREIEKSIEKGLEKLKSILEDERARRKGLGRIFMAISVLLMITAAYTLFFYVDKTDYNQILEMSNDSRKRPIAVNRCPASYPNNLFNTGPLPTNLYEFPHRWFSKPLAIAGISLFLIGFLVTHYDDIF